MKNLTGSQSKWFKVTLPENYATNYRYYVNARNEAEPNNSLATAETVTLDESLQGRISSSDSGEARSFTAGGHSIDTSIEDRYSFVVTTEMENQYAGTFPFDIGLEFYDAGLIDIDLFVFNSSGDIVSYSIGSNSATNSSTNCESTRPDLAAGTYYVGVDVWPAADNSVGMGGYTMSVTQTNTSSTSDVENGYWIADFYKVSVTSSTGLTITTNPAVGVFVTTEDGGAVLASESNTLNPLATETVLNTSPLTPGNYLIGIGYNGSIDAYEVTVANASVAAQ